MIESSRDIIERAIAEYSPYAIVSMISGGKDSMAAYMVAKELSVPVTHIMHGVTGAGIPQTTDFVREFAESESSAYIEANAGSKYVDYVQRKGFFGRGMTAHSYAYHILKEQNFAHSLSVNIRQRARNRRVLLINGARVQESANRAKNLSEPIRADGNNIWVNICHDWSREQRDDYLDKVGAPCNPVTQLLCRSGECLCGASQSKATRTEAAFFFPEWGKWLDDLERPVEAKFGWGWGDDTPSWVRLEKAGQMRLFQPLCVGCQDDIERSELELATTSNT